jgi:hypothetical protein
MKKLFITLGMATALVLVAAFASAQTDQSSTSPPLSQPLVREGDFAFKLADALGLGAAADETEAESALSAAGIAPRNGWIADYPITPDIVGELQVSVSEAADSGVLAMGKDEALKRLQDVLDQYTLNVEADTSGQEAGDTSGAEYPDSGGMTDYYSEEGPPVVTYYAPPPDYAYLYTWVPYPFWGWNVWFPGFFVLGDFDVNGHHHGHYHGHVSNHYRDRRTGRMHRIDPTNRYRGGTLPAQGGSTWSAPSAQRGVQGIVATPSAPSVRTPTRRTGREFRGYGGARSSVGTRSSVFDRSGNRQIERSSGGRGSQSRSNAGQIRRGGPVGGKATHGGQTRGSHGGGGGSHGGKAGGSQGGGGSRGGWRR